MSISTYLLETIRNQFEVFCIRVLQNEARDCYRELDYMNKKMVLFSDLPEEQFNSLIVYKNMILIFIYLK